MNYDPINCRDSAYTAEFLTWFEQHWCVKNDSKLLRASIEEQKRGAWLEWVYLQRGAKDNPRKYCDVFVDNASVDTKCVTVKVSRRALYPYIEQYQIRGARQKYIKNGIQQVHFWALPETDNVAKLWIIYYPFDDKLAEFQE